MSASHPALLFACSRKSGLQLVPEKPRESATAELEGYQFHINIANDEQWRAFIAYGPYRALVFAVSHEGGKWIEAPGDKLCAIPVSIVKYGVSSVLFVMNVRVSKCVVDQSRTPDADTTMYLAEKGGSMCVRGASDAFKIALEGDKWKKNRSRRN